MKNKLIFLAGMVIFLMGYLFGAARVMYLISSGQVIVCNVEE